MARPIFRQLILCSYWKRFVSSTIFRQSLLIPYSIYSYSRDRSTQKFGRNKNIHLSPTSPITTHAIHYDRNASKILSISSREESLRIISTHNNSYPFIHIYKYEIRPFTSSKDERDKKDVEGEYNNTWKRGKKKNS